MSIPRQFDFFRVRVLEQFMQRSLINGLNDKISFQAAACDLLNLASTLIWPSLENFP